MGARQTPKERQHNTLGVSTSVDLSFMHSSCATSVSTLTGATGALSDPLFLVSSLLSGAFLFIMSLGLTMLFFGSVAHSPPTIHFAWVEMDTGVKDGADDHRKVWRSQSYTVVWQRQDQ